MTSISSTSGASMSPADRVQIALQAAVSAGTVNGSDQSALSSAITDIDSSIQSGTAPAAGTSPTSIKSKVGSLIDNEVSSGKLTDDQATELKQVFAKAMGGHHHHMHMGGSSSSTDPTDPTATASTNPLDELLSDLTTAIDTVTGTSATSATSNTNAAGSTSGTSAATDAASTSTASGDTLTASIDQLMSFFKQLEQKVTSNYTAAGTTANAVAPAAMLVDANV